jgi:hypothetical protein
VARDAERATSAELPSAPVVERSPALLRQLNELMREGRRGQATPELIPFFCECRRAGCYKPVWLTGEAYDERRTERQQPLVLPGHDHARAEA